MNKHKSYISTRRPVGKRFCYNPLHHNGGEYLFADDVALLIGRDKDYVINRCKMMNKVRINPLQEVIPFDDVIAYLKRYGRDERASFLIEFHKHLIEKGAYEKK